MIKSKKLGSLLILFVLLMQSFSTSAQIEEIYTPAAKNTTATFVADDNNDLYIKSKGFENLDNTYYRANSSVARYYYEDQFRNYEGSSNGEWDIPNSHDRILEIRNQTITRTKLDFAMKYNSLLEGNQEDLDSGDIDENVIENIALFAGERYGFIVNVNRIHPHFINILLDTVSYSSSITLTIRMISPSGERYDYSHSITREVQDYIPFVPEELGKHIVFLETNRDIIIESLTLNEDPEIFDAPHSFSESLESTETIAKFFKIPGTGNPRVTTLNRIVTTYSWMGDIRIQAFSSSFDGMFGIYFSELNVVSDRDIWVVIIARPPNEKDPYIQGVKDDLGLEEGLNIEYTILIRHHGMEELPTNSNFRPVSTSYNGNYKYYSFTASESLMIGLNSSSSYNVEAIFSPLDNRQDEILISNGNYDYLNQVNEEFQILPAGSYTVRTSINIDYFIQILDFTDPIEMRTSKNVNLQLGERKLFNLPTTGIDLSRLNISLIGNYNHSATIDILVSRTDGVAFNYQQVSLDNYYNTIGSYIDNNFTELVIPYHTDIAYISIRLLSLTFYDPDGFELPSNTMMENIEVRLDRYDDKEVLEERFSNVKYSVSTMDSNYSEDLHSNFTDYRAFLGFTTDENKGYRIKIDTVNRSISNVDLFSQSYVKLLPSMLQNLPIDIANITHYILEFSFASTSIYQMGLFIDLGTEATNGSISVTIEPFELFQLPDLDLREINDDEFREPRFYQNPLFWTGVIGVISLGAVTVFIRRKYFS